MILGGCDIHNHLLPGVDDGFKTSADSLEAIRRMAGEGCRKLVFTPHMNPDVYHDVTEDDFRRVYAELVPQIPSELGVTTSLAAEYMCVNGFEERASRPEQLLTFPDGSILIEMSYYFRSANFEEAIFNLVLAGLKPIVAHPERYLYMVGCLEDFERWKDMGCRFQLSYMSTTGAYGPDSVKIMKYLLKNGMYDFLATDLHSLQQLERILQMKPLGRIARLLAKRG